MHKVALVILNPLFEKLFKENLCEVVDDPVFSNLDQMC